MVDALRSRLNWDGSGIAVRDEQGNISFMPHEDASEAQLLPDVPQETSNLGCIYMPMEHFLTRSFTFPLKHRHYLDADMLGQELADVAGINPDEWWVSWRSEKVEDGVAGVVFALPETTKQAIQSNPIWQQTPHLLVDGWERLNYWLDEVDKSDALAVIDADAEGVFFGLVQQGAWQGMRRLNTDMNDAQKSREIAKEVIWSLQSMGMDLLETQIIGRLTSALADELPLAHATHPPVIEKALSPRHMLNLMLPNPLDQQHQRAKKVKEHRCNIRHGTWQVRNASAQMKAWHRSAILAASLCFLWLGITITQNIQLENKLAAIQQEMLDILHTALPDEPNIDILAQLKRAANAGATGATQDAYQLTERLQWISEAFETKAWKMQELKVNQEGVLLVGKVDSLATLNAMRDMLAEKTARDVHIADTDLSGDEVSFRMRW